MVAPVAPDGAAGSRSLPACSIRLRWLIAAVCLGLAAAEAALADTPAFRVVLDQSARTSAFTGRVYVFLSRRNAEPRFGPDWFNTEPFLSRDVVDWQPGTAVDLDPADGAVLTYPRSWAGIDLNGYRAQAVARFNAWERKVGTGAGNGYGPAAPVEAEGAGPLTLRIDRTVAPLPFAETARVRLLRVRSALLSDFHGRDVALRAAVTLPASYDTAPARRYPTIFIVPGFGGTHFDALRAQPPAGANSGVEFLRVLLDPSCPLGHHVFADSENNGPVNRALREELIPEFDRQFRSVAEPWARFLTGHSSGGWSSLWLQVTAPDEFGGVWSTAPDPVDFRDFQRINLYRAGENMFVDANGARRPLARGNGRVLLWYDDFSWMEHVLGFGGQLHSFEAVFSPRGDDGRPQLLWDRMTGEINPAVAAAWERYDIRLLLERRWDELADRLAGKLHVFMGAEDTFYLEGATRLLQESLTRLGSDAVVAIHPDKDHGSLLTPELLARIEREMAGAFVASRNAARAATGKP